MEIFQDTPINELPICGVLSVSKVSNKSLEDTFNTFKKLNKKANNWKGRTLHSERVKVLKYFKVKFQEFKLFGMTLKTFTDLHTVKDVTYIINTTSHIQVIKNGTVTDQRGTFPISKYWGRNKNLKNTQIKVK